MSMKSDVAEISEQRDAMKGYIHGLENALSTLQQKFESSSTTSFDINASIQEKIILDQVPVSVSTSSSAMKSTNDSVVEEVNVKKEEKEASMKGDFKIKFMQKAFKSLLKARDSVSIRRHSEVMCSLLSYNSEERTEVFGNIEKIGPLLSALGMHISLLISIKIHSIPFILNAPKYVSFRHI